LRAISFLDDGLQPAEIARKVGVDRRSLGWSPQKPQRRAIERDEAAIQRWVKTTWPKVKKTPRG
jgi:hypothetical protein